MHSAFVADIELAKVKWKAVPILQDRLHLRLFGRKASWIGRHSLSKGVESVNPDKDISFRKEAAAADIDEAEDPIALFHQRFGRVYPEKDLILFDRLLNLPHWLAKKYESMAKLVNSEVTAKEDRERMLVRMYENLRDPQDGVMKTGKHQELEDLVVSPAWFLSSTACCSNRLLSYLTPQATHNNSPKCRLRQAGCGLLRGLLLPGPLQAP